MAAHEQRRCRVASPTLASLVARLGALFLTLAAAAEVAHAEPEETPLAQMRSAAELQAEVDPERLVRADERLLVPPLARTKALASIDRGRGRSESLRQIALNALRSELARELDPHDTPTPHAGVGAKEPGGHDSDAQARTAAIAAQQARQAHSVAIQHGVSAVAGKGNVERD